MDELRFAGRLNALSTTKTMNYLGLQMSGNIRKRGFPPKDVTIEILMNKQKGRPNKGRPFVEFLQMQA